MDDLTITTMPLPDGGLLRVRGALSLGRVEHLVPEASRLLATRPRRVVIDLNGLVYISSLGVGHLLALCDAACDAGGEASIACDRANVLRMLRLCRADLVASIVPTVEEALAGVGLAAWLDAA